MTSDILTESHAARLRAIARRYTPRMGKSWRHLTPDELWLRVLAQIVVAGNAAPADMLERSEAVKEKLAFSRLRKLSPRQRRQVIHSVLRAIGTRYVGEKSKNAKIDAVLHNFDALRKAGGPVAFFKKVAAEKDTPAMLDFLEDNLHYYKKKGCRDTLIELRLASDCMALDQRIKNILEGVGLKLVGSVDRQYEQIETELRKHVAKPLHLSGGQLDRILFQNYGDIMVRLLCP
jgi:hypothetical protein